MNGLSGNYLKFYEIVSGVLPKNRVFVDDLHKLAYGTDASFYSLTPKIVVVINSGEEAKEVLKISDMLEIPITFRAAGSSVSGQSISDSVLVMLSRDWREFEIKEGGDVITLSPATIGDWANEALKSYDKKLGPDPASIRTGFISGIVANNASGMCAGVEQNSYNTLKDMKIILQDGFMLDTSSPKSRKEFETTHKKMCDDIMALKAKIEQNNTLKELIERKFSIKNTCGYYIKAFLDFDNACDITAHLMVGSEGTLGFLQEITFYTVDDLPKKASAIIFFENIKEGAKAIQKLKKIPRRTLRAAELMDRASLRSVQDDKGMEYLQELGVEVSAILLEVVAKDEKSLKKDTALVTKELNSFKTVLPIEFSSDESVYSRYWDIRKGMFPKVCSLREPGTTVFIEDIAFPIDRLDEALVEMQGLFEKYDYKEAIMFGHSLDGNVHFIVTADFSKESEIKRYEDFMSEIVHLVAKKYKGSLKAEHGTGRNMAPFVEYEWGEEAYSVMKRVKEIFDSKNLLNPDVLISSDKKIHLKNFKTLQKSNPLIDLCIECGFCEPNCPSNALTLTPRQRIVINRKISSLSDKESQKLLKESYKYDGLDTCAACSLCSLSCPVGIDVANLTKELRGKEHGDVSKKVANSVVNYYDGVLGAVKVGLGANSLASSVFGEEFMQKSMDFVRDLSRGKTPKWSPYIPKKSKFSTDRFLIDRGGQKVVYFPSCLARTFGNQKKSGEDMEIFEVVNLLINRAGYEIVIPKAVENLCCGTPMSSKGYKDEAKKQLKELEHALYIASDKGRYPILCETSPCVKAMVKGFREELRVYEPIEFTLKYLVPKLQFKKTDETVAIHSTCSTVNLGLKDSFLELAKMCSANVIVPQNVTCCGFAGDRGFSHPELNAKALRWLKKDIGVAKEGFSTSITCEIGLSQHGEIPYKSILYLVERVTREK